MGDTENPLAAAATAEPRRHGFWAWKERFVLNHLTLYNPAEDDADAANGVASADGDQGSRRRFLWGSTLLAIFVLLSTALLLMAEPSTTGPAVYLASRVVGYAGQIFGVCCGLLLLHLWQAVRLANRKD